ncbi:alcohol oxidase [Auricularia subglabra TFB-10046 SS5]|nr:alcohol oxidase [Auricularia subglabra TFB-10046 SS5]
MLNTLWTFLYAYTRVSQLFAPKYDFIVIGGGTAGLAVSTRLSQLLPSSCILVIEAGPDAADEPTINIPGLKGANFNSKYDWNLTSVPQPGANGRTISLTRGKVLGGSSALNFMGWDRASRAEFDAWGEGWTWEDMSTAMLRAENFTRPTQEGVYGRRGVAFGGPIQTVVNAVVPEQQSAFIPTMENLGLRRNLESLGGYILGTQRQPSNIRARDYARSYSTSYLQVAGPNLRVMTDTTVTKINFSRERGKLVSTGVTLTDGTVIKAAVEVVLSAGSYHSPHLLELSGIGNSRILRAAGIAPLLHVPGVGEHLQDHIRVQNSYQLKPGYLSTDALIHNGSFAAEQRALYDAGTRGGLYDQSPSSYAFLTWDQLGANLGADMLALAASSADQESVIDRRKLSFLRNPGIPNVEVIFTDGYIGARGYPLVGGSLYGQNFFTLVGGIMHPLARGSVHVNASAPSQLVIDPRYLGNAYDATAVATVARYLRKIAETPPLRDLWDAEYEPGTADPTAWDQYALNTVDSIYHPTGTCAMLPLEEDGVVNRRLVVHGTKNLRVVDASVLTFQISAHIQTAVYGIAERAATLIAQDHSNGK